MATIESIVREEHVESLTAVIRECVKRYGMTFVKRTK